MKKLEPRGQWKYRWELPSSSSPDTTYVVAMSEHGDWACGCIGWTRHFPRKDCKHIRRVKDVEPIDTVAQNRVRVRKPAPPTITPRSLTLNQIADIEAQLKPGGPPQRFSKPSPQKQEPFFVRQTRRAIDFD